VLLVDSRDSLACTRQASAVLWVVTCQAGNACLHLPCLALRPPQVTTKQVAMVDLKEVATYLRGTSDVLPREAMQALDIALRHAIAMRPGALPVGRSVYFRDEKTRRIGGGAEVGGQGLGVAVSYVGLSA
jgi:hypothetical protein